MKKIKLYRISIIVLIGVILTLAFLYIRCVNSPSSNEVIALDEVELTDQDKIKLGEYAYSVLDSYYDSDVNIKKTTPGILESFDYDKLYITYIHQGSLRCSQSGSNHGGKLRVYYDLMEANVDCIEDDRFGGVLTVEEYADVDIVFNFLFNKNKLYTNALDDLEDIIELGIHAIRINTDDGGAYFKESVPISKNYDLEKTFERLCRKAGDHEDCIEDSDTDIYIYDTFTFKVNRASEVVDLYRYNLYMEPDSISSQTLLDSIQLGGQWFLNNIDPDTELLEYMYYPSKDEYSSGNNHVRQLASLWAMSELKNFLETDAFDDLISRTIDHYLQYKTKGNYFMIDESAKIAYNAFMIMVLTEAEYPEKDQLLADLGEAILSQQYEDGSYHTYFASEKNTGIDYYPGESMLALMKLYELTEEQRYLDSVRKAFPYYRDYWRDNKNTAFVPWHSQVYLLLYQEIEDPELAEFVFEMNDWLIDNYQVFESEYIDIIGGIPKRDPRYSTSVYMEGINDAYRLAILIEDEEHQQKYADSIRNGVRFMLQTQYNSENTFYLSNPERAIGGFTRSHVSNEQRNDFTQHAVLALIKTYENEIYK